MVLVDTSVWIRALGSHPPYAHELDRLLNREEVVGHALVFGELLIGDRSGRKQLLESYQQIFQAGMIAHEEVVAFVRARSLYGRGIGWVDVHLLASTIVEGLKLWTADQHLSAIAEEAGVAHKIAS